MGKKHQKLAKAGLLGSFIVLAVLISGCVQEGATCNSPYVKIGEACCLDQNNNKICDTDEISPQCELYKLDGKLGFIYFQMSSVQNGLEKDAEIVAKYNTSQYSGSVPSFMINEIKKYNDSKINDFFIDLDVCTASLRALDPGKMPDYPTNYTDPNYQWELNQYQQELKFWQDRSDTWLKKSTECNDIYSKITYRLYTIMRPRYENNVSCPSSYAAYKADGEFYFFSLEIGLVSSKMVTNPLLVKNTSDTSWMLDLMASILNSYQNDKINELMDSYRICYTRNNTDSSCQEYSTNMMYRIYLEMKKRY